MSFVSIFALMGVLLLSVDRIRASFLVDPHDLRTLEVERIARYEALFLPVFDSSACRPSEHPVKHISFAIGILSVANATERRSAIRNSWLRLPNRYSAEVAHTFVLALNSDGNIPDEAFKEGPVHHDILVINHQDAYANITMKSMAIMRWGTHQCQATFAMKMDDDVFLQLETLMHALFQQIPVRIYAGNPVIHRLKREHSTFNISRGEYPSAKWPVFMQGAAYVLSYDLAHLVAEKTRQPWFRFLNAEDVAIGLFLKPYAPYFVRIKSTNNPESPCNPEAVVMHYCTTGCMQVIYANRGRQENLCDGIERHTNLEKVAEWNAEKQRAPLSGCKKMKVELSGVLEADGSPAHITFHPSRSAQRTISEAAARLKISVSTLEQLYTTPMLKKFLASFPHCQGETREELYARLMEDVSESSPLITFIPPAASPGDHEDEVIESEVFF